MKDLFLIDTYIRNGTHKSTVAYACIPTREMADKIKKKIDEANKNCDVNTYTDIYPVKLYENESEVPILQNKPKDLQERLVQCCIDYINETGDNEIQEVNFRVDSLQESAKSGDWQPCTDSFVALYTYVKDENGIETRKSIGEYQ